jgi:hypothetical protein
MASVSTISVQIPANTTTSGAIDLGTNHLVAIEMPETWTGTTLNIQAKAKRAAKETESHEDWDDVYDSAGNQIAITVAQGRVVVPTEAHAAALAPLRFIRFVSTPAQNPSKEIRLIVKQS